MTTMLAMDRDWPDKYVGSGITWGLGLFAPCNSDIVLNKLLYLSLAEDLSFSTKNKFKLWSALTFWSITENHSSGHSSNYNYRPPL